MRASVHSWEGAGGLRGKLRGLGLEAERCQVRCWIGQPSLDLRTERRLRALLAEGGPLLQQGRVLSLLGRYAEARERLDLAVESGEDPAWRGELLLMEGEPARALEDLDRSLRRKAGEPWPYVYRACARFRQGDLKGAVRDLEVFRRLEPRSPAGWALRAVLEGSRGRKESAARCLAAALRRGGGGWVFALRGSMRARWNDLRGARRDFDSALRREDSPWMRLERSALARRGGFFWEALGDLKVAARFLPDCAQPHLLAASICLDQARYERAAEHLSLALDLEKTDPAIYHSRARVRFVQGMLREAQEDLESAMRLSPAKEQFKQEWLQLLIVRGFEREAHKALEEGSLSIGAREFWRGYMACRAGRYQEASERFSRAAGLCEGAEEALAGKARFYRWVARVLAHTPGPPPERGRALRLVGLGYRHPFQISAGALAALRACEVFYSNLSDPRVSEFMGLFPVPVKAIVYRGLDEEARASARTVMAGFDSWRRIGMVTRGQPVIYGRLAHYLVKESRRRGIPCLVSSSVSICDTLPALVPEPPWGRLGLQVVDAAFRGRLDLRLPVVVYLPTRLGASLRSLLRGYPRSHPCYLQPGAGEGEFAPRRVLLSGLVLALAESDPACTLYLPPVK